jgi:List-Bact-rpt repeat protein
MPIPLAGWVRSVVRTSLFASVLAVLILTAYPVGAFGVTAPSSHPSLPSSSHAIAPGGIAGSAPAALAPRPAASPTGGLFWSHNNSFATQPVSTDPKYGNGFCYTQYNYCYNQTYAQGGAQVPSVLNLSTGDVGIGYQVTTTVTSNASCAGGGKNASSEVRFSLSSTGGKTFYSTAIVPEYSCAYTNSLEPAFALGGTTIYGVLVQQNSSEAAQWYFNRSNSAQAGAGDILVFTKSTNGGTSFSVPSLLNSSQNIAHPVIAAVGDTVYVVYENISNGTSRLPGASYGFGFQGNTPAYPISLWFTYTTNGGTSWSTPKLLPGENSSSYYTSMGPSIAVSSSGAVAVSYATNRSCALVQFNACQRYGFDIVVITSTNNGTSWTAPLKVASNAGGSPPYTPFTGIYPNYPRYFAFFQEVPQTAVTFGSSSTTLYVAYAATYNRPGATYYYTYNYPGIFAGVSINSGTSWTTSTIAAQTTCQYSPDAWYNPGIAYSNGNVYVTYSWTNGSYYYYSSCGQGADTFFDQTVTEFIAASTDGSHWTPALVDVAYAGSQLYHYTFYMANAYLGYSSAIGFNASGGPVLAYTLGGGDYTFAYTYNATQTPAYHYYYNYTYWGNLTSAFPYSGPMVTVNFTENNITGAVPHWTFNLNLRQINVTGKSLIVNNVPSGKTVYLSANPFAIGYREQAFPVISVPAETKFTSNTTVWFNYTVQFGFQLVDLQPQNAQSFYMYVSTSTAYYYYDHYCYWSGFGFSCGNFATPWPWNFIEGQTVTFYTYAYPPVAYWNGTGVGSYNGTGQWLNITFGGAVNESVWLGMFGTYTVYVNSIGLPSSSTYTFGFDGTSYSASAGSMVNVSNVSTGAHRITDITATSTQTGWRYFGFSDPANPIVVPTEDIVNLTFAYVNTAAASGAISFHAVGLTAGTVWDFKFNGTTYSSTTPWINVTAHPGTYPVAGFTVVSQNNSVGYTPSVPATMSVTTGSTYDITFTQTYKVGFYGSTGGKITGGGAHWLASGVTFSSLATPNFGYGFGGWTGSGVGSYTGMNETANVTVGGPVTETATFYPLPSARFNLTFVAQGLPAGTDWTVFVNGTGYSSSSTSLVVPNLVSCPTSYAVQTIDAYSNGSVGTRYVPNSVPRSACTDGTTTITVSFQTQYFLTLQTTTGGSVQVTVGSVTASSSLWVGASGSVQITAVPNPGYNFLGWNGSGPGNYTGTLTSTSIVMSGEITELATFALPVPVPPPKFHVSFVESQLIAGTVWTITFNNTVYSSATAYINVTGFIQGAYPLSVGTALSAAGTTRYLPTGNPLSVTLSTNRSVPVNFATQYWVSVAGSSGGTITGATNWYAPSAVVSINATPLPGYVFLGWNGTGPNAYSGLNPNATVRITGPVTEYASFGPQAPAIPVTTTLWQSPLVWGGLAAAGLVVGLGVGLLVRRRRSKGPGPMTPANVPSDESGSMGGGT